MKVFSFIFSNDTNSLHDFAHTDIVHPSSVNPSLPTDPDLHKSNFFVEDAVSITTDFRTISTTEFENNDASDRETTSANRLSYCAGISHDIPLRLKTPETEEAVQALMVAQIGEQLTGVECNKIMSCGENISEAGPTTAANIDNINNIPLLNDSRDLEFISKVGGTGLVAENLRKQSLYVKFDPLVANEVNNSSINGDTTLTNDISNLSLSDITIDSNCRAADDDRNNCSIGTHSSEVTNSNEPVGKLISVTPNKSPRKSTPKSSPKFSDTDPDDLNELKSLLLKQMKREETFKEEIDSIRREYEQALLKLQNTEKEKSQLRNALELSQENEKKLKNELKERIKSKQQLSMVMEEYEKTISQMVTRRDEEKREFEASVRKIEAERDSAIQHLNNLENAFNDVHQKYERGKIVNDALKKNEDMLKKSLGEYEVTVKTVENKYELLKSHATSQLEKANQELELITQSYEKEQAKLKAMLRKSEIQINSLQNALDQKAKENQELAAVCDELIIKLSTHSNA